MFDPACNCWRILLISSSRASLLACILLLWTTSYTFISSPITSKMVIFLLYEAPLSGRPYWSFLACWATCNYWLCEGGAVVTWSPGSSVLVSLTAWWSRSPCPTLILLRFLSYSVTGLTISRSESLSAWLPDSELLDLSWSLWSFIFIWDI